MTLGSVASWSITATTKRKIFSIITKTTGHIAKFRQRSTATEFEEEIASILQVVQDSAYKFEVLLSWVVAESTAYAHSVSNLAWCILLRRAGCRESLDILWSWLCPSYLSGSTSLCIGAFAYPETSKRLTICLMDAPAKAMSSLLSGLVWLWCRGWTKGP